MRKQRFVVAGVTAIALAGLGSTAFALQAQDQRTERGAVAVQSDGTSSTTSSAVRVVRPYEPVAIGRGALMGLLPEGKQNYVVAYGQKDFRESIELAKGYTGDDIRPNTISGGYSGSDRGTLFTGAFRTDVEPAKITIKTAEGTFDAKMLRLPGDPGWGTYYLDAGRTDAIGTIVTVTAYAPDGTVIDDLEMDLRSRR